VNQCKYQVQTWYTCGYWGLVVPFGGPTPHTHPVQGQMGPDCPVNNVHNLTRVGLKTMKFLVLVDPRAGKFLSKLYLPHTPRSRATGPRLPRSKVRYP